MNRLLKGALAVGGGAVAAGTLRRAIFPVPPEIRAVGAAALPRVP